MAPLIQYLLLIVVVCAAGYAMGRAVMARPRRVALAICTVATVLLVAAHA